MGVDADWEYPIQEIVGVTSEGAPTYAQGIDIANIFGNSNVSKWADLDNKHNEDTIVNRVTWALGLAYQEVNGLLRSGPYSVPFTAPLPAKIVDANARLAGCYLYDGRGIPDVDENGRPANKLAPHRDMILAFIADIMGARMKLEIVATSPTTYPQVVPIRPRRGRFRGNQPWYGFPG
jgi:hypothetical protein